MTEENNQGEEITPEDSVVPVFLKADNPEIEVFDHMTRAEEQSAIKEAAVDHLMTTFGFTEEMARAVVGG